MSVLALNGGSSSVKCALYSNADLPARLWRGSVERSGTADATCRVLAEDGAVKAERRLGAMTPAQTARALIDWLRSLAGMGSVDAIGHRIVHGGTRVSTHQRITPDLMAELDRAVPLDPSHLPAALALIRACESAFNQVPQVACFDTVFHRDLPAVAKILPIPRRFDRAGVRRYGFHGLSYEFLMSELERIGRPGEVRGRVILAHLGSGASMAAVLNGKPRDTTMAFTPAAGLVMGTRPGDLDPGVLVYLARSEGLDSAALDRLVNTECGLLGVSETSADMRDLIAHRGDDARAAQAVELFCSQARKWIGALAAVLGGIDTLVFAGGIGEHAPQVRAEICKGLEFLGIRVEPARNQAGETVISSEQGAVLVRVMRTDEELMIVRHVRRVLGLGEGTA